jgi:hypothetical protein
VSDALGETPVRIAAARLRPLGVLPLAFTVAYGVVAAREGRAADTLWMCHVSNALLGIGMLLGPSQGGVGRTSLRAARGEEAPRGAHAARLPAALVRIAALWIVLGFLLWPLDIWTAGGVTAISIVAHAGGLAVALLAISRIGMTGNPWLPALVLMLAVQQLCRWFTPPELNVNLAHRVYTGFDAWFAGYPVYWLAMTALAALGLWAIGRMLSAAFPASRKQ